MSKIQIKDALKAAVESASDGAQTVIYTDSGQSCIMNVINKFTLESVGLGKGTHPAFIVNGKEVDKIYIGTYMSTVVNKELLSLANAEYTGSLSLNEASKLAKNNGKGWHVMTAIEWAAIIALCAKDGFYPTGNNNHGASVEDGTTGRVAKDRDITLNGTGALSWRHDNSYNGISDMTGNGWENISGARLMAGELQVFQNNDAADSSHDLSETSALWKTIDAISGDYITPTFTGSIKDGDYQPTTPYSIRLGGDNTGTTKIYAAEEYLFRSLTKTSNSVVSDAAILKLKQLGMFKIDEKYEGLNGFWTSPGIGALMRRSGHSGTGGYAGIQSVDFQGSSTWAGHDSASRVCYYEASE